MTDSDQKRLVALVLMVDQAELSGLDSDQAMTTFQRGSSLSRPMTDGISGANSWRSPSGVLSLTSRASAARSE